MSEKYGTPFADVLACELESIAACRRAVLGEEPVPPSPAADLLPFEAVRHRALDLDLVGLAFSGGGIRSATVSIGVLQGLVALKLLPVVDYLSTVSGGGYAGGWLAAWVKREGDIQNVQKELDPGRVAQSDAARYAADLAEPLDHIVDEEPEPVRHLRDYSRYLSPRFGMLSGDTWTLISIYLRNLFINNMLLLPTLLLVVLLGRVAEWYFGLGSGADSPWFVQLYRSAIFLALFFGLLVYAYFRLTYGRARLTEPAGRRERQPDHIWRHIVLPLTAAAVLGAWCFTNDPTQINENALRLPAAGTLGGDYRWLTVPALTAGILTLAGWVAVAVSAVRIGGVTFAQGGVMIARAFFTGLVFGVALNVVVNSWWDVPKAPTDDAAAFAKSPGGPSADGDTVEDRQSRFVALVTTFGPPLLLLLILTAGYSEVALLGRRLTDHEREWRSRIGAYVLMVAFAWVVFFTVTLWLPKLWPLFAPELQAKLKAGAIVSWLVTTLAARLATRRTPAKEAGTARTLLMAVGPLVFLAGLIAILSAFGSYLLKQVSVGENYEVVLLDTTRWLPKFLHLRLTWGDVAADLVFLEGRNEVFFLWLVALLALLWGLTRIARRVLEVNLFSLHATYANRLVRCYLGASRRKARWAERWVGGDWRPGEGGAPTSAAGDNRRENPLTGFDADDDFPLCDLRTAGVDHPYLGPYPLFNTALNLVAGTELATQDRKAEAFVLTPDYCGSRVTGYAPTPAAPDTRMNVSLGWAMAISGAAADPNMSVNQSAPQTAFLTILNARLGWWIQNPNVGAAWDATGPKYGRLLLDELLGRTDAKGEYVHLSDGGHFENLGAYELIRRRCRFIIAVDAAEDWADASENLANFLRLVRTDFGIRIDIDTTPVKKGENGLSKWHCAVGTIHYDDVDPQAVAGTLVFLRSSLTGDEPADLKNYAANHPDFPHTSTAQQFFDEAQFESYRMLGQHIAREVFSAAADEYKQERAAIGPRRARRKLFAALRRAWFPPPPDLDKHYVEACAACLGVVRDLGTVPDLRPLNHDFYPELVRMGLLAPHDLAGVTEFRAVDQMMQLMELSFLGIDLDRYHAHPLNRGWMNTFRRWTATAAFQRYWPVLAGTYSKEFVEFCQRTLNVQPPSSHLVRMRRDGNPRWQQVRAELNREFAKEWPRDVLADHAAALGCDPAAYLDTLIARAAEPAPAGGEPLVWFMALEPERTARPFNADWRDRDYPVGVIAVRRIDASEFEKGFFCGRRPDPRPQLELTLWVRGPYRVMGLGSRHLEALLAALPRVLFDPFADMPVTARTVRKRVLTASLPLSQSVTVLVRYPATGSTPGDRLQRAMWMNFFHEYEFRRRLPPKGSDRADVVLERIIA